MLWSSLFETPLFQHIYVVHGHIASANNRDEGTTPSPAPCYRCFRVRAGVQHKLKSNVADRGSKAQTRGRKGSKDPFARKRCLQETISTRLRRYALPRRIDYRLSHLSSPYTETNAQITTSMATKNKQRARTMVFSLTKGFHFFLLVGSYSSTSNRSANPTSAPIPVTVAGLPKFSRTAATPVILYKPSEPL